MRLLGHILLFCLAIAALQALLAVAAVIVIVVLVAGLIFRTRVTLGLVAFLLLLRALEAFPLATIGVLVGLPAAFWIADRLRSEGTHDPAPVGLLTDECPPGD